MREAKALNAAIGKKRLSPGPCVGVEPPWWPAPVSQNLSIQTALLLHDTQ